MSFERTIKNLIEGRIQFYLYTKKMKKNKSQLFSVFGILSILLIWFVFSSLTNEEMVMPSIATIIN